MRIKPPKFRRTFDFFRALNQHFTFGQIAQWCGKELQTAEAWAREPESDENPNGSGKKNPVDAFIRLLGKAHAADAGLAREWASIGTEYIDFLDGNRGREGRFSLCQLAALLVKEHAEVVAKLLSGDGDSDGLWKEIADLEAAFNQLKACVKQDMAVSPVREFARGKIMERKSAC